MSRHRRHRYLLAAAVVTGVPALLYTDASATNRTWLGGAGTGNWNTPALWTGGILPGPNDDTFFVSTDTSNRTLIQNAGAVTTLNLHVNNSTQIGTNVLILPASTSLNTFLLEVGTNGKGEFVNNGGFQTLSSATLNAGGLMLSVSATGRGSYTLTNGGFLTVNNGSQGSTRTVIGQSGFATFTHNNGNASFNSSVTLGENAGGVGSYLLSGSSSVLNVGSTSLFTIGAAGAGSFVHDGGFAGMSKLHIGSSAGGRGLYSMTDGNLNINTAAQFDSTDMIIGNNGDGTFSHTGGFVNLGGPRVGIAGLNIGAFGTGAGTYLLSGTGQLSVASLDVRIGGSGTGHFIQSGGNLTAPTVSVGANGRYVMSGNGSLNLSRSLSVSEGPMTQSGGVVNVGNGDGLLGAVSVGQLAVTNSYQLSGGTINLYGLGIVAQLAGGAGSFQQTAGTHKVKGVFFVGDLGGLVPGAVGTYSLSGGRLEVTPAVVTLEGGSGDSSMNGLQLDTGGTIIGGAADGVFAGKMTQQGGTIAGTFRNEGQIVSKGGAVTGTLLNRNRITMNGGTMTVGSIAISNEAQSLIDGAGTISGAVNNIGRIVSTGALAISTINNTTPATIEIGPGTSLRAAFIDNFNTIRLDGGSLAGVAGQVNNNANAANGGGLISGGGTIEPELHMNGGIVRADLPTVPLVIKDVAFADPTSQFIVAANSTLNIQPAFSNQVSISLQGNGARLIGGTITNAQTISGAGQIASRVLNTGIVRAQGGELILTGVNNTNLATGQLLASTGNTLTYASGLANNLGLIQLTGGEFNNNGLPLINSGRINGRGTLRAGSISNSGSMLFSGGVTDVFGAVTNTGQVTVTGNGAATFFDNFTNGGSGNFTVTLGSSAVFLGSFSGLSTISGPGTKDFESIASTGAINATGTTIVGPAGNVTTNFIRDNTLDLHGRMTINPNGSAASVSRLGSLLIDGGATPTGTLNLSNNDLIVTSGNKSLVTSQIAFARNAGAWNRAGITSSAAASATPKNTTLGVLSGQQYRSVFGPAAQFDGFAVADSDVLVKYTFYGDSDFNGQVNFDDYARIDAGFNSGGNEWFEGDFDLNGTVNFDDYALIDLAFNSQSGTLRLSAVPEPGSIGLVTLLVAGLTRRDGWLCRRRKTRRKIDAIAVAGNG